MSEPAHFTGPNVQPGDWADVVNAEGVVVGRFQFGGVMPPSDDPLPQLLEQVQAIESGLRGFVSVIDRIVRNDALTRETALRVELIDRISAAWSDDVEDAWEDRALAAVAVDVFAKFIREAQQ